MFIKFLFKIEDVKEVKTNIKCILKFKNKNLFEIDELVEKEYKLIDNIYD